MHIATLVGQRFYPAGKPLLADANASTEVTLVREPENPFDPNAVAVHISGVKVGHLARADAALIASVMDAGNTVNPNFHPLPPILAIAWEPDHTAFTLEDWASSLEMGVFNEDDGDAYYVTAASEEKPLEDWRAPPADAVSIRFYGK